MISSIELNYDLSEEVNLVNFEQVVVQPNVELFVHIPSLMPNIKVVVNQLLLVIVQVLEFLRMQIINHLQLVILYKNKTS